MNGAGNVFGTSLAFEPPTDLRPAFVGPAAVQGGIQNEEQRTCRFLSWRVSGIRGSILPAVLSAARSLALVAGGEQHQPHCFAADWCHYHRAARVAPSHPADTFQHPTFANSSAVPASALAAPAGARTLSLIHI